MTAIEFDPIRQCAQMKRLLFTIQTGPIQGGLLVKIREFRRQQLMTISSPYKMSFLSDLHSPTTGEKNYDANAQKL
jgi:hypothetical protein